MASSGSYLVNELATRGGEGALQRMMGGSASYLVDQRATHGGGFASKRPELEGKAEDKTAKKKLVRVDPKYIRALQVRYSRNRKPYPTIPEEVIKGLKPEMQASIRAHTAAVTSNFDKRIEHDMAILNQYNTQGYAEIQITDDEDEEITDEQVEARIFMLK